MLRSYYLSVLAVCEEELLTHHQEEVHVLVPLMHLVQNDVSPGVEVLLADDHPLEDSGGDVEQSGVEALVLLVESHLVSHQPSQPPVSLLTDSLGQTAGSNLPWLGDDDVDILLLLGVLVQDVLWHLGGLAAASRARQNHYLIT